MMISTMTSITRVLTFALLSLFIPEWARAQGTEGIKETERFIKVGGATAQSVAEARLKTKNALDA